MNKRNVTLYYGLTMAIYSIGYVTMSAFSSVYLLDIGLSNGGVGILLAIGSLLSVLLQPFTGALIDRNPKISTKGVLLFLGAIILALGVLIISIPNQSLALSSVLYCTAIMLLMLAQPFMNALGMDALNGGYPINLGMSRSIGSLGYALGSYAFGYISVLVGPRCIPFAFSVAFFVFNLMLFFYPVKGAAKSPAVDSTNENISENHQVSVENTEMQKTDGGTGKKQVQKKDNPFLFLLKYKRFAIMLIGLVMIYFSHCLINTFALQIVTPKGGTSEDMGTASAIAAGCELLTAILFSWYMKRIKLSLIIKISGVFFALKTFCSFLVTSVAGFFAIQALQMFGWGFMSVGIVYYVNDLVGENDKAQGQAYAGMSFTIGSVLATFLGGNIIDLLNVDWMLIIGSISAAIGTIVLWVTAKEISKTE